MSEENQIKKLAHTICCNYSGEGYCGDKSKCNLDCWSGRTAKRLHREENYRKSSVVASKIFAEIEVLTETCIEKEYSSDYGFAERSWFNITKFKNKIKKIKKKYESEG